jgi:crotonobetainyl-CoA:carnitine CoA-transferase CaiB-like acyl-CoA transferase
MNKIFENLKVIELSNVLAGPAVGMFFSELGASVLKIENRKTNGDVTRTWKLTSEDKSKNSSAYFASVNWNKTSLLVDFTDEGERNKIYDEIKNADLIITNYKKGDDYKLGFDYQTIRKLNPTVIYARLTGFGTDSSRTAYDLVLQAETGFMFMNGTPESGPVKMPVALIDVLAAHQLKEAILIAMMERLKSGKGSLVTVSLFDAAIASLANQAANWLVAGHNPQPLGTLHPNIAPYGELFKTKDERLIVLAIGSEKEFHLLCTVLEQMNWTTDARFQSNYERVKNRSALASLIANEMIKKNASEWMNLFIHSNVPAGLIKSIKEVFDQKTIDQCTLFSDEGRVVKTVAFNIQQC